MPAVVKPFAQSPGADRELSLPRPGAQNVIPVLDSGEHMGQWAIVMPRADRSLAQHLTDAGGSLSVEETITVLLDVAVDRA
ncbi:hypothetical protein GCM10010431_81010 [Streptomyces kunmingensis]